MTGRDVIRHVITFAGAPRIGFHLPDPWPNDFCGAGVDPAPGFDPERRTEGDAEVWRDEWGNTWRRLGGVSKGEVAEGAIRDWSDLASYVPPDFSLAGRYEAARERFAAAGGAYRLGGVPGCAFNLSRKLRRLENFLVDCLLEPDRVRALNALVVEQMVVAIGRLAEAGADGVMFPEDWGTQDRVLVSPETFRDLFLPTFERLCGAAADAGVDVWMHSCGLIRAIVPDLVAAGVKVLQFDQPELYGVDRLASEFGGRVTFMCPVDIQRTLQTGDRDRVRSSARELVEKLGRFGAEGGPFGGFIAQRYPDEAAIGLRPEAQDAMCEAFVEFGGAAAGAT